jgi:hypothetical protein
VNFATPVAVTAGTVYIASYYTPTGHYSNQQNFFATSGLDNGPLHALANTTSANGVYAYGSASSFPNQTWLASNYWVDVVFAPTAPVLGTLAVTPGTLNFGSVITGSSASQNLTVTANTASVTISQANVTGAGFSISGLTLPVTLAAGQSATFQVRFAPTAVGSVSGSVSLVSNGSNSPTAIALSGTGATAIAHSAALTWTASTSTGVVGYNVYRGTQTGGPYTKLTASPVAVTSYTDTGVQAGANYYYVVTAVNSTGQESTYSNQVLATIPTP